MADMDARVARVLSSPEFRRWYGSTWRNICLEAEEVGWVQPGRRRESWSDENTGQRGRRDAEQTGFTQEELDAAVQEKWPSLPDELCKIWYVLRPDPSRHIGHRWSREANGVFQLILYRTTKHNSLFDSRLAEWEAWNPPKSLNLAAKINSHGPTSRRSRVH